MLGDRGMLDYSGEFSEEVGFFTVGKKNGKQRAIWDARRFNCWFREPDPVALASGESLNDLRVTDSQILWMGQLDIANAFYMFSLPRELRRYFFLPAVPAHWAGVSQVEWREVGPNDMVWPRLAVVPMGWTHALVLCQRLHERLSEVAGLLPRRRLHDKTAAPPLSVEGDRAEHTCLHLEYVDNFASLGISQDHVASAVGAMQSLLERRGLVVHEVDSGSPSAQLLGWMIDGVQGTVQPTARRLWRLRYALEEVLSARQVTGRAVEKLVGHCTFLALIRRESLSCFAHVYSFIRECRHLP